MATISLNQAALLESMRQLLKTQNQKQAKINRMLVIGRGSELKKENVRLE